MQVENESPEVGVDNFLVPPNKRKRRQWSDEEKKTILRECEEGGLTFSAASKKHGIPTNQLFQWRKQFESISLRLVNGGATSESASCSRTLSEIDKLERLQNMTIGKLTEEIRRSQITSYNASIALSNLVNGLTKLDALRAQAQEKLEQLHPSNPARAMPFDEATLEEERMAEILVIEMVREQLRREQEDKMRGTAGGANV